MLCFINHLLQLFPVGDPSCLPTTTTTMTEKPASTGVPQTTGSPAASQTTTTSTTTISAAPTSTPVSPGICGKPARAGDHSLQFDINSTISGYEFDEVYNNKGSTIYKSITQHLKSQVRVF